MRLMSGPEILLIVFVLAFGIIPIGLAALTYLAWTLAGCAGGSHGPEVFSAIAVLIISCPCALGLATLVALGRIFVKAGRPMWEGVIPIVNFFMLPRIVGRPVWWGLLIFPAVFVPVVGAFVAAIVQLILMIDLAKAFGRSAAYGVGLFFLAPFMLPILAFGDAQYQGNVGAVDEIQIPE